MISLLELNNTYDCIFYFGYNNIRIEWIGRRTNWIIEARACISDRGLLHHEICAGIDRWQQCHDGPALQTPSANLCHTIKVWSGLVLRGVPFNGMGRKFSRAINTLSYKIWWHYRVFPLSLSPVVVICCIHKVRYLLFRDSVHMRLARIFVLHVEANDEISYLRHCSSLEVIDG